MLFWLLLAANAEQIACENDAFEHASEGACMNDKKLACAKLTLKLPNLSLYGIDDAIIMNDASSNNDGDLDLRIRTLRREQLDEYLFANFFAHPMNLYRQMTGKIADNDFNKLRIISTVGVSNM